MTRFRHPGWSPLFEKKMKRRPVGKGSLIFNTQVPVRCFVFIEVLLSIFFLWIIDGRLSSRETSVEVFLCLF